MNPSHKTYDTIIVGAGIAGLTSAAYLASAGRTVLLVEKNKECGGLVNTLVRDGFRFDAGVRALLDAGIVFPMLKELGLRLEVVKSPVSLGIEKDILHIEDESGLAEYGALLRRLYPESPEDIRAVLAIIRRIMKDMDVLYGIENPMFKDVKRDLPFVFKTLLPWLPKFLFTVRKINRMNGPVEYYLEAAVKNSSLRDIISQHFFRNTPAFFALSYFSLYLDYVYPKGGMGKLAEALVQKTKDSGGDIRTEVKIIEVAAGRRLVKDQNGGEYAYDNLVWAADLKTFHRLVDTKGLPSRVRDAFERKKSEMLGRRGGDSVYTLFLEIDEPLETFKAISNGHFFYTPSKRGLGRVHREELDRLLHHWDEVDRGRILAWMDDFTKFNTYEISIPGLKDPDSVPPGQTGLIVSFLAEYDLFDKALKSGWVDEFNAELEARVLNVLGDSVYPMLKDKEIRRFSFSPLDIERRIGSSEGAITGWSFQDPVPVINKIQKAARSVLTPIPSIYQAGQWAYSPAGVPMSILTGKIATDKILKKKRRSSGNARKTA
ncbi:MAG: NAD(P)/FAD-dependent oxidoreductase [Candidatus Aminicenantes bacterium]|nr:NAD(P)/FAD-dependent oxidoreductase [Candidatus Aminicenantes bacterium]